MLKRIYVGNLPYSAYDDDVRALFEAYGEVHSVDLIIDRQTGHPRGFGFVEMDESTADEAIENLNNAEFQGRRLRVNEARPKQDRGPRGPEGDRGGFGGGGDRFGNRGRGQGDRRRGGGGGGGRREDYW